MHLAARSLRYEDFWPESPAERSFAVGIFFTSSGVGKDFVPCEALCEVGAGKSAMNLFKIVAAALPESCW